MSLAVKVDEDLPRAIAVLIRHAGHDAATVVEQGLGGSPDAVLWKTIQAEARFLVTADKGFANIREHPPGAHAGILLLRPAQDGIRPLVELMQRLLRTRSLDDLRETVTVVTPRSVRIRRRT
jgi:predicted nuclease of predicted toxin-antitoxin system